MLYKLKKTSRFFIDQFLFPILISNSLVWFISDQIMPHSALNQNLVQSQKPGTKPTQGWSACFKDSKNVLHEILANRAWKGRAS